jgi:hypothetical protein
VLHQDQQEQKHQVLVSSNAASCCCTCWFTCVQVGYALLTLTTSGLLPWELLGRPLLDMLAEQPARAAGNTDVTQSMHVTLGYCSSTDALYLSMPC